MSNVHGDSILAQERKKWGSGSKQTHEEYKNALNPNVTRPPVPVKISDIDRMREKAEAAAKVQAWRDSDEVQYATQEVRPVAIHDAARELYREQDGTHDIINALTERLRPFLRAEEDSKPAMGYNPTIPASASPLHRNIAERVLVQEAINTRLRDLLERVDI